MPVIVKLGNDKAINTAVSGVASRFPNSFVVDFGSPQYYLIIWRTHAELIIISHEPNYHRYTIIRTIVRVSPASQIYLLGCNTAKLAKSLGARVHGFSRVVDARIAPLLCYI